MKPLRWSLKFGRNVFLVPVIPGRISFAILAARAFKEWDEEGLEYGGGGLDDRDIVALSLPECLADCYVAAIADLPRPSVLFLSHQNQQGGEFRELVSISPTDGFTEAARQAATRNCRLRFIDIVVDPSQIVRDCSSAFPQSFDDGAVLLAGVHDFMVHCEQLLSTPPIRREPIDSVRESALTIAIQSLAPACRHLFVFCSAPLLQNIRRMLPHPQLEPLGLFKSPDLGVVARYSAGEGELLNNLDDFPYYAEFIEEQRGGPLINDLDRMRFVEECLLRALRTDGFDGVNTRRLRVLTTYLRSLCQSTDRCSPSQGHVIEAVRGALGDATAERVLTKLYSFRAELDVRAVVSGHANVHLVSRRKQKPIDNLRVVRRDCSSNGSNDVRVVFETPASSPKPGDARNRDWQPTEFHEERLEKIRQRVLRLAVLQGTGKTSREFRSSLEDGIDLRRSVRSIVRDDDVFVRARSRGLRASEVRSSPIVWIVRHSGRASISTGSVKFSDFPPTFVKNQNIDKDDEYVRYQYASVGSQITNRYNNPQLTIGYFTVVGWINFLPFVGDFNPEFLRGSKLSTRLPNHRTMVHPAGVGCLEKALEPLADSQRWDELLLLTASLYAERCVILVAPANYDTGDRIRRAIAARKLVLLRVGIETLTSSDIFMLSRKPGAEGETEKVSRERFNKEIWPELEAQWKC